jgi:hypothetical protein
MMKRNFNLSIIIVCHWMTITRIVCQLLTIATTFSVKIMMIATWKLLKLTKYLLLSNFDGILMTIATKKIWKPKACTKFFFSWNMMTTCKDLLKWFGYRAYSLGLKRPSLAISTNWSFSFNLSIIIVCHWMTIAHIVCQLLTIATTFSWLIWVISMLLSS